jgi:hypothetical protein
MIVFFGNNICYMEADAQILCCVLQELLNTSVTTVLYLIAFIVQLSVHSTPYYVYIRDRNIAAGVGTHVSLWSEVFNRSQIPPPTEDNA